MSFMLINGCKKTSNIKITDMKILKITVGNENFGAGRTSVTIYKNGDVSINNVCDKNQEVCEYQINSASVEKMLYELQSLKLKGHQRKYKSPDEAKYSFEIDDKKEIEIWDNDLSKYEELNKMMKQLRMKIYEISNHEIIF